jgi:hypothetical protein
MNESEKLLDFIDGNLSLEEEQALFYELSTNDELRQKLKHLMAIEQSVSANPSFYAPTVSSTNAIFNELGFAPPKSITHINSSTTLNTIASFVKNLYIIIPGITILLLSGLGYLYLNNKNTSDFISDTPETMTQSIPQTERNIAFIEQYQDQYGTESDIENSSLAATGKPISYIQSNKLDFVETGSENSNNPNLQDLYLSMDASLQKITDVIRSHIQKNNPPFYTGNNSGSVIIASGLDKLAEPNFLSKFSIDIAKHNYTHTIQPTVEPSKDQSLKDISLTVNYRINSNMQLGAFYIKETFFQQFDGVDEFSRNVIYEQQPIFNTLGIKANYIYDITENISINSNLLTGYNLGGLIGGGGIDFSYNIYAGISLNFGVEYKALFYEFQGRNFNSTKYGTNFGISYNFR